jgi:hypothetical protein
MVEAAGNWETASAINEWVSAPFLLPPRALTALLGLFRRGFRVAAGGEFFDCGCGCFSPQQAVAPYGILADRPYPIIRKQEYRNA